jgi:hypothetical protein
VGLSREQYSEIRYKAAQDGTSHFEAWNHHKDLNVEDDFFETITYGIWDFGTTVTELANSIKWPFDFQPVTAFIAAWIEDNPQGTVAEYLD